ncbi:conserved hypothetical protein [Leishmania major strain Friedlin]|uniref:AAA+ ATPase domain-containing protein n=1 Tax=Leishmania major TaxID=5664 RepID=Q4QGH0_LEIMA|nr:conserved hypothetical protein [Leishmania major strain Friedlin]CAG9570519.1 hypothetical_protein_-_conserved [Leishmania major strain Friedlin]CAJ03055.1 conserved hypothetical protein [Leishmania major strain Friedlin]|eukprot:XP_001681728.1 conserved hypothetical protein [Leishmania major strain Friedlin]
MYFHGPSSSDVVDRPSLSRSPPTICTGAPSTAAAALPGIQGQQCGPSPSSALSSNSTWINASFLRALHSAYAATPKAVGQSDGERARNGDGVRESTLFPCAVARLFHAWYEALATTRACAVVLPPDVDGPLVVHLTLLLVGWEMMQATSLYLRHRRAMRVSAKTEAEATQDCDENAADAEEPSDFLTSRQFATAQVPSPPEMESVQTGQSLLPRSSTRAVRRLCSYWALIEKAVRAAPRKRAGAPTNVAALGWFVSSELVGHNSAQGGRDRRAFHRLPSDAAPHGAGTVLVLSDQAAFPVMTEPGGSSERQPGVASYAASLVTAEKPAEVAEPWRVMHFLWTDVVRYSVTYTELRQLLLGCTVAEIAKVFENAGDAGSCQGGLCAAYSTRVLPPRGRGNSSRNVSHEAAATTAHCVTSPTSSGVSPSCYADPRVAVACVALTWYLSLVREVYDAVIVHEDVQRCAGALEELEGHSKAMYQHGVQAGLAFFEEELHNVWYLGVADASSGTGEGCASGQPHCHEHPMVLPEVVSTTDDHAAPAAASSSASMAAGVHLSCRRAGNGNHSRCGGAGDSPLALSVPPRSREECVLVGATHTPIRVASPRACWAELNGALAALLLRRRLMELLHVRSLFSYMYTSSVAKMVSSAVLTGLTCLSSRVAASGQVAREAISSNLDTYYRTHGALSPPGSHSDSGSGPSHGGAVSTQQRILSLCLLECMRLAVNTVLTRTTHAYINMAASHRRNAAKAELYEALTRLPLAFFDTHSFDEVEQIVYYVNDIEGVEVHVHHYICSLVMSLFAMQHAVHQLPCRARLLVGATVAVSLTVKCIGQRIKQWVQVAQRTGGVLPPWLRGDELGGVVRGTAELDAQVEENTESNARQGGVMLRGLDIVAVLPQLRLYAADLSLMRWWTHHTRACGAMAGATEASTFLQGLLVLPFQAYGHLLPALGGALMTFADWVLPTLVASYGASMAFCSVDALSLSNRLVEAMRCIGDTVDAVVDGRRVAEVVLLNAYKANILEKVLDARRWEPTTADYARGFGFRGEADEHDRDKDKSHDAGTGCATRAGEVGSPRYGQGRYLLQSLRPADSHTVTTSPPSLMLRWMHILKHNCCWCVTRAPPIRILRGYLRLVRSRLATMGIVKEDCRGNRRRQSRKPYYHHRCPNRPCYLSCRRRRRSPQEDPQPSKSLRPLPPGSASAATDACLSNHSSEDDVGRGADARPSSSPCSDDSDVDCEAAAAATLALLTSGTVHAVTVRNVQFCYPTTPTVPVFSHPITCSFVLQGNRDASPSSSPSPSPSSASPPQRTRCSCSSRGRLVCLVGPSGHGKSTLLSLLLGMYTHYETPSHILDKDNDASRGAGGGEVQQQGGAEALDRGAALFNLSSPAVIPDIVLTLAHSSDELEPAGLHDAASTPAASAVSEVVYEQLSVASIPRDILRGRLFSFVPQSPVIFSGATIAHNISLENYVSLEQEELLAEIAQCAAWAHCEYIHRFPQGLMTYIADSGAGASSSPLASAGTGGGGAGGGGVVRLSIGQAQRLMMARALFHGRRGGTVLVMDEPTASLDKEVKLQILGEWRELLDSGIVRGAICATHDDDLIAVADQVVRLP